MHMRIPPRIKNRQENQSSRANDREECRKDTQNLLRHIIVLRQPALVS